MAQRQLYAVQARNKSRALILAKRAQEAVFDERIL
jgi:hypothetical protein